MATPRIRTDDVYPYLLDGLTEEPNLHRKVVKQRPVLDAQEHVASGDGDAEPMSQGSTKEHIQTKDVVLSAGDSAVCFCGVDWQDGPMLQCFVCKKTSHGICYKILLTDQPIPQGACLECSETYPCFNPRLSIIVQKSGLEKILNRAHIRMVMFLLFGRSEIAIRDLEKLFTEEKSETILEFLADLKIIIPSDAGNGYYVEKNALYANYEKSLGRVNLVELIKLSEQSEFNKKINLKEDASMPMESMSLLAEGNYEEPPTEPENSIPEHTGRQGGRSLKRKKKAVNMENPRTSGKSSESKRNKI
ncbi:uncharacterized protein LOC111698771 [Eurytemora carolleeae]|uniref:uncharacterized protein LOC111698771 n=1 Tax=Eurytemora carolleeae TaxID=1294199 RepID=UPI000C7837AE|nr:uncharacterized protein LOC111698771 [Eurytemora carolleeae]|eukprot:XP_023324968.1 uncharacterized protein LOC111698771 [Eurytemora affinis]